MCYIQHTPVTIVKKLHCAITCRERKKEHSNEVAHCLTEYLERLLHNTNYERNLKIEYHDELCVNVSQINRASFKFLNGIVKRRVCKLTDPRSALLTNISKIDTYCIFVEQCSELNKSHVLCEFYVIEINISDTIFT